MTVSTKKTLKNQAKENTLTSEPSHQKRLEILEMAVKEIKEVIKEMRGYEKNCKDKRFGGGVDVAV